MFYWFWYHLNFWYRGTNDAEAILEKGFGIISIFGIEEQPDEWVDGGQGFGIISIFGIEEHVHYHVLIAVGFGIISIFGIEEQSR